MQTGDGYLLGVHRLPFRKGEEDTGVRVNAGPDTLRKPVVYLHHGLLMNSEVWVCLTEEERCLPFTLVNQGYDVWLGNNRGNKYSKKSTKHSPISTGFWNFSMDEFAFHDIPDTIDYILNATSQPSLSYIGFSQGTAQAFATLSIHPGLNDRVNLFVALAPAMSPAGLNNGIVDALVKTNPNVLFLAFGRKSILSSATMWQSILYPPIFVRLIDMSLSFLFAWYGRNITVQQKLAAYPHLYSFTSTKSVVHWFQIIRNKSFQMYDDDGTNRFSIGASNRYYKVAKFPTRNIKTPIVLVYGGSDSLVDIRVMLKELPRHTIATEIPHFEHLDFLWAQDVDTLVFPHVLEALRYYALGRTSNGIPKGLALSIADTARLHRRQNSGGNANWSEDESGGYSDFDGANESPHTPKQKSYAQQQRERQYRSPLLSQSQSPLQYQYQNQQYLNSNQNHNPNRPASGSATSATMNWMEGYYKLPKREAQATNEGMGTSSSNPHSHAVTDQYRDSPDTPIDQNSVENSVEGSNQTPSAATGTDVASEDSSAPPTSSSTSRSLADMGLGSGLRYRPTLDPDNGNEVGNAGHPTPILASASASAFPAPTESEDGRSSPTSTSTTPARSTPTPPAFTAQGIRVGSSRPSVGAATS